MGMKLYQPKCCSECCYIRPYGDYKICSYPFFPAEMSILDISSFKVTPDAVPDWCPLKKINDEIASMSEEERNALNDICNGLATLLGWPESNKQENSPVLKQHPVDRWIPYGDPDWNAWECSKCGAVQYLESGTPLENEWLCCPHCGKRLYEEMARERHGEVY